MEDPSKAAPAEASLHIDRPIQSRSDDKLRRAAFADQLGAAIAGWKGDDSLTIGIDGKWGDGKTSIVNIAAEYLGRKPPKATVVQINAWQLAGHSDLTTAFFTELAAVIRAEKSWLCTAALTTKLYCYAQRLSGAKRAGDGVVPVIEAVGVVLAAVGFAQATTSANSTGAVVAAAGLVLAATARIGAWALARLARGIGVPIFGSDEPLPTIKERIETAMSKRQIPLCVVIDDLDRMESSEVRDILRLVRSNADFPKLVYVLCLDYAQIEKVLHDSQEGRRFLDKIIQVHLRVPALPKEEPLGFFFAALEARLKQSPGQHELDEKDGQRLSPIYAYLKTTVLNLRDAYRLLACVSFRLGIFETRHSGDVNILDLVALSAISEYNPDVYDKLPSVRQMLLRRDVFGPSDPEVRRKRLLGDLGLSSRDPDALLELLAELFPKSAWCFGAIGDGADNFLEWQKEKRVCHDQYFDRYFEHDVAPNTLTTSEARSLLADGSAVEEYEKELRSVVRRNALTSFVDQAINLSESIGDSRYEDLLAAAANLADDVEFESNEFFGQSPAQELRRFTNNLLFSKHVQPQAGKVWEAALKKMRALWMPVAVAIENDPNHNKPNRTGLFTAEEISRIREDAVGRIERAAQAGSLRRSRGVLYCLFRWKEWRGIDAPSKWFGEQLEDVNKFLELVEWIGTWVRSTAGNHWEVHLSNLKTFCTEEQLARATKSVSSDALKSDRQRKIFDALNRALAASQRGESSEIE